MVFNKHLKYGKIIESVMLFFFHLQDAQTDKTPIECSREHRECVLPAGEHFFPPLRTDKLCDKAAINSKKTLTLDQKWLCNKQILIRYHEKLNPSVQKF